MERELQFLSKSPNHIIYIILIVTKLVLLCVVNALMLLFTVQLTNELFNHAGALCKQASSSSPTLLEGFTGKQSSFLCRFWT